MMRELAWAAIVAAVTMIESPAPSHRAAAVRRQPTTISGLTYLSDYSAGDRVKVWRGVTADIVVRGQFLDLSTGVEVKTASGSAASGVSASITARQGGIGTQITVRVSASTSASLGDYQVLIHYTVETSGPDKFDLRVFDVGRVDQIQILEAPAAGGLYVVGQPYTLSLTGDRLDNVGLNTVLARMPGLTLPAAESFLSAASLTSKTASLSTPSARISIRFDSAGTFNFQSALFNDRHISPQPFANGPWSYGGSAVFQARVRILPVVTSVSPQTPNGGSSVTISGSRLITPHYNIRVTAARRYDGISAPSLSTSVSGGNVVFTAQPNMQPDSIVLHFDPDGTFFAGDPADKLLVTSIAVPPVAVQGGTPAAFLLDTVRTGTATRSLLIAGQRTLRGMFLAPNTLPASLTSPVRAPATSPIGTLPTLPLTLSFGGTALTVNSMRYDRGTTLPNRSQGADIITYTVNPLPDTVSHDLVVTTPFGSSTVPNVLYLPPPTVTAVRRRVGPGQTVLVTDGKLFRSSSYEIAGSAIMAPVGGAPAPLASVRLNGTVLSATGSGTTPASVLITIPTNATSGALTLETLAGSVSAGTFTVENAPVAVSIVGMQVSPIDVVGGAPMTGTVALNAAVPAGTTAGNIVLTKAIADPAVILPPPVPITTNPTTFQIATHAVNTVHTVGITASSEAGATNTTTATATIRVHPPAPTTVSVTDVNGALTPNAITLVGGQSANGMVTLNGTAALADSVRVTLTSSDPTTVVVPASATVLNFAEFDVTTRVVPSTRIVTITATSDGRSATATLTVQPPTIASIAPAGGSTIIGAGQLAIGMTFNASLPSAQTATITCVGEGLTCPPSVSATGSSASFNVSAIEVPTARTATITATLNGVAKSTTVSLQPFAIASVVASPSSVTAGNPTSITVQLNRAVTSGLIDISLASSDTSVVKTQTVLEFAPGQITRLISLPSRAPQTQPKSVTITATGTRNTSLGPAPLTGSTTVTVTP